MEDYNWTDNNILLKEFYREIKQRWLSIFLLAIAGLAISAIFTFLVVTPTYSSTVDLVVNQPNTQQNQTIDQSTIETNLSLLNTYEDIIKKPTILEKVIKENQVDMTVSELAEQTIVTTEENSLLLSISVESNSPYLAADLANSIADVFVDEVQNTLQINNVFIWNSAEPILKTISPNFIFNLLIGFFVGAFLAIIYYILNFLADPTVKSDSISEELNLTLLGVIPQMSDSMYEETVLKANNKKLYESDGHRRVK